MSSTSCFWAFLHPEQLRFLYVSESVRDIVIENKSINSLLLHHSLFEFIHPDELTLAHTDLAKFIKVNTLAGSITRCRLRSFRSIATQDNTLDNCQPHQEQGHRGTSPGEGNLSETRKKCGTDAGSPPTCQDHALWDIVDFVMYTAAENVILAFFHNANCFLCPTSTHCRCHDHRFHMQDTVTITGVLQIQGQPKVYCPRTTIRVFQIYDSRTGTLIFSWPEPSTAALDELPEEASRRNKLLCEAITLAGETIRKEYFVYDNPERSSNAVNGHHRNDTSWLSRNIVHEKKIACTHHIHSSSIVTLANSSFRFERIFIPYGHITFHTFQMTPVDIPHVPSLSGMLRGQSTYRHYMHCSPPDDAVVSIPPTTYDPPDDSARLPKNQMMRPESRPFTAPTSSLGQRYTHDEPPLPIRGPSAPTGTQSRDHQLPNNPSAPLHPFTSPQADRRIMSHPYNLSFNYSKPAFAYDNGSSARTSDSFNHHREASSASLQRTVTNRSPPTEDPDRRDNSSPPTASRVCSKCRTSTSPEWRRGPTGHKTLCNACGLRYSRLVAKQKRQTQQQNQWNHAIKETKETV